MRKKLIELLTETHAIANWHRYNHEAVADHLLASDFINCLQNEAYDLGVDSILRHKFGLSWDDAAELRKEVARLQAATKWIPVTERLPENDGRYLVRKKNFNTAWFDVLGFAKDGRKVDEYDFEREWENVWYRYDSEYGYVTTDSVTHWMPIPEPPKEV